MYQNGGRRSISGSSAEWLLKAQAAGATPKDLPPVDTNKLQDTVELIVVPHPDTSPTAADPQASQLLRQRQAQQPAADTGPNAHGQGFVLNGGAAADGHAEAWLGRALPPAAGDSPSGSSSELAGSSEDGGGGELSAPRMLDPSQAYGCVSAVVVRLAPAVCYSPCGDFSCLKQAPWFSALACTSSLNLRLNQSLT